MIMHTIHTSFKSTSYLFGARIHQGSSVPDPFWISKKNCMHRSAHLYLLSKLLVYESFVPIPERGGTGGQESFIQGGSAPRSKPLPFFYTIVDKKVIFGFHTKWYPFYIPTEETHLTIFFVGSVQDILNNP